MVKNLLHCAAERIFFHPYCYKSLVKQLSFVSYVQILWFTFGLSSSVLFSSLLCSLLVSPWILYLLQVTHLGFKHVKCDHQSLRVNLHLSVSLEAMEELEFWCWKTLLLVQIESGDVRAAGLVWEESLDAFFPPLESVVPDVNSTWSQPLCTATLHADMGCVNLFLGVSLEVHSWPFRNTIWNKIIWAQPLTSFSATQHGSTDSSSQFTSKCKTLSAAAHGLHGQQVQGVDDEDPTPAEDQQKRPGETPSHESLNHKCNVRRQNFKRKFKIFTNADLNKNTGSWDVLTEPEREKGPNRNWFNQPRGTTVRRTREQHDTHTHTHRKNNRIEETRWGRERLK